MQKEALSIINIANGDLQTVVDGHLVAANIALDSVENEKAKAVVTLKIEIEKAGEGGNFRAVSYQASLTPPKEAKKADLYAVQLVDGKRMIVTDPVSDDEGDDGQVPGQTAMFGERIGMEAPASNNVAQFPQAANG